MGPCAANPSGAFGAERARNPLRPLGSGHRFHPAPERPVRQESAHGKPTGYAECDRHRGDRGALPRTRAVRHSTDPAARAAACAADMSLLGVLIDSPDLSADQPAADMTRKVNENELSEAWSPRISRATASHGSRAYPRHSA